MTLFEAVNARVAFYRQVALFAMQKDDATTMELCVDVLNESLPDEFKADLTDKPVKDGKLGDVYERELWNWDRLNMKKVESAYTRYMNMIAMKYMH